MPLFLSYRCERGGDRAIFRVILAYIRVYIAIYEHIWAYLGIFTRINRCHRVCFLSALLNRPAGLYNLRFAQCKSL